MRLRRNRFELLKTLFAGRIKSVFEKLIYLWNRLNQKIEGNLARSEEVVDFNELERTRKRLAQMRSRTVEGSEMSGAYAMEAVRRRMTGEFSDVNAVTDRKKTREAVNKWLLKDQIDTGSFNPVDFDKRMKEVFCDSEERPLEPLPAVEDTFMAFSKSDDNLFEQEQISLSGIHYMVDPLEDFDEAYSAPALPMYASSEAIDFTPTTSFAPDQEDTNPDLGFVETDINNVGVTTSSNPMLQVLGDLEERMAAAQRKRDAYWVD